MKTMLIISLCLLALGTCNLNLEQALALDVSTYTDPCVDEQAFQEATTRLGQWIQVLENPTELASDLAVLNSVQGLIQNTKSSIQAIKDASITTIPEIQVQATLDTLQEQDEEIVPDDSIITLGTPIQQEQEPEIQPDLDIQAPVVEIQPVQEELPPLESFLPAFVQIKSQTLAQSQSNLQNKVKTVNLHIQQVVESVFASEFTSIFSQLSSLSSQDDDHIQHDDLLEDADNILAAISVFSEELQWAHDRSDQFGEFITTLTQLQADLATGLSNCLAPPQVLTQKDLTKLAPDTNDIQPQSVILEMIPDEVGESAELEAVSFLQTTKVNKKKSLQKNRK